MKRQLKVSYRNGKPLAAYMRFADSVGVKSVRTEEPKPGILVDYSRRGRPIGIEITSPSTVTLKALNDILSTLGEAKLAEADLAPLKPRPTDENDHQRLLYLYGQAASLAQQLEKNLLVAFVASKAAANERLTKEDRAEIALDPSSSMLIRHIRQHLEIAPGERRLLNDCWNMRIYLFHSFMVSKEQLSNDQHVRSAKRQLQAMIERFIRGNTVALSLRTELLSISGLQARKIERDLEEIKEAVG